MPFVRAPAQSTTLVCRLNGALRSQVLPRELFLTFSRLFAQAAPAHNQDIKLEQKMVVLGYGAHVRNVERSVTGGVCVCVGGARISCTVPTAQHTELAPDSARWPCLPPPQVCSSRLC